MIYLIIGLTIGYFAGIFVSAYRFEKNKVRINRSVMEVTENVFSPKLGKRIVNNVN